MVEELFRAHAPSVQRFARRLVHDEALADEVVQEVFARLHAAPTKFDPSRGTALAYLLAACRGRALDLIRAETARARRQGLVAANAEASTSHVEEAALNAELGRRLHDALDRLSPHERVPILLSFFGGFTYSEVADLLFLAPGTVKSRIRRGLIHLHDILEPDWLAPEG